MRLAIIIGHTQEAQGAQAVAPLSTSEWLYNGSLAQVIAGECQQRGINAAIIGRNAGGIRQAYAKAKEFSPDACIELHFNAASDQYAFGTETLYCDQKDGPMVREKELAQKVQEQMCKVFQRQGKGDRGLKNLASGDERGYVNMSQIMEFPCILVEPFFGSNPNDAELGLLQKNELAKAIVEGFQQWYMAKPSVMAESLELH